MPHNRPVTLEVVGSTFRLLYYSGEHRVPLRVPASPAMPVFSARVAPEISCTQHGDDRPDFLTACRIGDTASTYARHPFLYRTSGRNAPLRKVTIGAVGKIKA
jgi:hypothetical protein